MTSSELPPFSGGAPQPVLSRADRRFRWWLGVGVALLSLMTLAAIFVTNGNIVVGLAPSILVLVVYAVAKLPLRYPVMFIFAVIFTLDTPAEPFAGGKYQSPLHLVSELLTAQLKHVIPGSGLIITGLDLFIVGAFLLHGYRRATRSKLDRDDYTPTPIPLLVAAWVCLAGIAMAWLLGLATGGSFRFSLWQVQRNLYLPLMFLLFQAAFPSPRQFKPYFAMLIVIACLRSVMALWLREQFPLEEYATSHSDSMLFGTVTCLVVIRLMHGTNRRERFRLVLILLLLIVGMVENERRLVWVQIAVALAFVFVMTPWSSFKVKLIRRVLYSLPIVLGYLAAGWNSSSSVFAPVATVRSMVDSKSDGSTLWRDLENFNLVMTFRRTPLTGTGFGHPFDMIQPMPDITAHYELEPYVPHNSVVGLWAYTGYVGFTMLWMILLVGCYLSARTFYVARERDDRTAALTTFCALVIYMLHCYGDMGLGSWVAICLICPLLALVGKLAVKVGAWRWSGSRRRSAAPAASPS